MRADTVGEPIAHRLADVDVKPHPALLLPQRLPEPERGLCSLRQLPERKRPAPGECLLQQPIETYVL